MFSLVANLAVFDYLFLYKVFIKDKKDEKTRSEEEKERFEKDLLRKINKDGNFEDIKKDITPTALSKCKSSSLLMAMKVFNCSGTSI